jgi:hypothetical protein
MDTGGLTPYQIQGNSEYRNMVKSSQILSAKVQNREGNSPDRTLRALNKSK